MTDEQSIPRLLQRPRVVVAVFAFVSGCLSRRRVCSCPRHRLQHVQDAPMGRPSPSRHPLAVTVELRPSQVSSRLTVAIIS
jgi:hypothetical protein